MRARILAAAAIAAVAAPSISPEPIPPVAGPAATVAHTRPASTPTTNTSTDASTDTSTHDSNPDADATDRDDIAHEGAGTGAEDATGYSDGGWTAAAQAQRYTTRIPPPGPAATAADEESARLARLIEDVTAADGYRYMAVDSAGATMDTAKVIDNPAGGYLAVYHTGNTVKLATSGDLARWQWRADLDRHGSQPTIVATSDGGFVVAFETEAGDNGHVQVVHYRDLPALYTARPDRKFTAPRTLSRCNEGTPSISSIRLAPDIDHSVIELGLHYHHNCDTDREATARLTNFRRWRATPAGGVDRALSKAAATIGRTINGNIGDRDSITVDQRLFTITEVQYAKGNFGTWQPYLYDATARRATPLTIRTHRGSRSFANPTISWITAPNGSPALLVSLFIPAQGAALFEAGELIYYRTLRPAGPDHTAPGQAALDQARPAQAAPNQERPDS